MLRCVVKIFFERRIIRAQLSGKRTERTTVTMNAELKKRRLEVFSDEPGPSTVSASVPHTGGPSTVSAPVPRTAELFKPVEYLMKCIN